LCRLGGAFSAASLSAAPNCPSSRQTAGVVLGAITVVLGVPGAARADQEGISDPHDVRTRLDMMSAAAVSRPGPTTIRISFPAEVLGGATVYRYAVAAEDDVNGDGSAVGRLVSPRGGDRCGRCPRAPPVIGPESEPAGHGVGRSPVPAAVRRRRAPGRRRPDRSRDSARSSSSSHRGIR